MSMSNLVRKANNATPLPGEYVLSPTIIQLGVVNDSGKGVYNMFLVYLIGQYIGIYGISWLNRITTKRVLLYSIIMLLVIFLLNNFMVFVNAHKK